MACCGAVIGIVLGIVLGSSAVDRFLEKLGLLLDSSLGYMLGFEL